jgi:sigma-B regulation protein RsbU (phosphoserine phosphatase)
LKYVNDVLTRQSDSPLFVMMFYGILHTGTGELEYCIAGHNRPYVLSNSASLRTLDEPAGMMAGAFEHATFETGRTTLKKNDTIFLFTDAITEAIDVTATDFSKERLCSVLGRCADKPVEEIVGEVMNEVKTLCGNAPQLDDFTGMAVRYVGTR